MVCLVIVVTVVKDDCADEDAISYEIYESVTSVRFNQNADSIMNDCPITSGGYAYQINAENYQKVKEVS